MTIDVKGGGKMPVEKYCIGILARDMPAEYEEEALKAGNPGADRSLPGNPGCGGRTEA